MLERLVESIVVEYLSAWVEGLDAKQTRVALFRGHLEFRSVRIRSDVLDKFFLPVKLCHGRIGRLHIQVPWNKLATEPVLLKLEDLELTVAPLSDDNEDGHDAFRARQTWAKQQELHLKELVEKNKHESSPSKRGSSHNWSYRDRILQAVMNNVVIEIDRVHLRYEEDNFDPASQPFYQFNRSQVAMGVTIDSIRMHTTNANGHQAFVDPATTPTPFLHRTIQISGFGIYCDTDARGSAAFEEPVASPTSSPVYATEWHRHVAESFYILQPMNVQIKATTLSDQTNAASDQALSVARQQIQVHADNVCVHLTARQCQAVNSVLSFIAQHETHLKVVHLRRQRPKESVRDNPGAWWRYAFYGIQVFRSSSTSSISVSTIGTSFRGHKKKCSWKRFAHLWLMRNEYIRQYKRSLYEPTKSVQRRLMELEDELSVDTILFYRRCSEKEREMEVQREASLQRVSGWKSRWSYSSVPSETTTNGALHPLEKLLLYEELYLASHQSYAATTVSDESGKVDTIGRDIRLSVDQSSFLLLEERLEEKEGISDRLHELARLELSEFALVWIEKQESLNVWVLLQSLQGLQNGWMMDDRQLFLSHADKCKDESGRNLPQFVDLRLELSDKQSTVDCTFAPLCLRYEASLMRSLVTFYHNSLAYNEAVVDGVVDNFPIFSRVESAETLPRKNVKHSRNLSRKSSLPDLTASTSRVRIAVWFPSVRLIVATSDCSSMAQVVWMNTVLRSDQFRSGWTLSTDTLELSIGGDQEGEAVKSRRTMEEALRVTMEKVYEVSGLQLTGAPKYHRNGDVTWVLDSSLPSIKLELSCDHCQYLLRIWNEMQVKSHVPPPQSSRDDPVPSSDSTSQDTTNDHDFIRLSVTFPRLVVILDLAPEDKAQSGTDQVVLDAIQSYIVLKSYQIETTLHAESRLLSMYKQHAQVVRTNSTYDRRNSHSNVQKVLEIGPKIQVDYYSGAQSRLSMRSRQAKAYWDIDFLKKLINAFQVASPINVDGANSSLCSWTDANSMNDAQQSKELFRITATVDRWQISVLPSQIDTQLASLNWSGTNLSMTSLTLSAGSQTQLQFVDGVHLEAVEKQTDDRNHASSELMTSTSNVKVMVETSRFLKEDRAVHSLTRLDIQSSSLNVIYDHRLQMQALSVVQQDMIGLSTFLADQRAVYSLDGATMTSRVNLSGLIANVSIIIPRGTLRSASEQQKKAGRVEVSVGSLNIASRAYPLYLASEQYLLHFENVRAISIASGGVSESLFKRQDVCLNWVSTPGDGYYTTNVRIVCRLPSGWPHNMQEELDGTSSVETEALDLTLSSTQYALLLCLYEENLSKAYVSAMTLDAFDPDGIAMLVHIDCGNTVIRLRTTDQVLLKVPMTNAHFEYLRYMSGKTQLGVKAHALNVSVVSDNEEATKCMQVGSREDANAVGFRLDTHTEILSTEDGSRRYQRYVDISMEHMKVVPVVMMIVPAYRRWSRSAPEIPHYTPSSSTPMIVKGQVSDFHCFILQYEKYEEMTGDQAHRAVNKSATDTQETKHLVAYGQCSFEYKNEGIQYTHIGLSASAMDLCWTSNWSFGDDNTPSSDRICIVSSEQDTKNHGRTVAKGFHVDASYTFSRHESTAYKTTLSLDHFHPSLTTFDLHVLLNNSTISPSAGLWTIEIPTMLNSGSQQGNISTPSNSTGYGLQCQFLAKDVDVTIIRQVGSSLSPVLCVFSSYISCGGTVKFSAEDAGTKQYQIDAACEIGENDGQEQVEHDGVSVWGFNSQLGAWEPLIEPFPAGITCSLEKSSSQGMSVTCAIAGRNDRAININVSPSLIRSFRRAHHELLPLLVGSCSRVEMPLASRMSWGFHLVNNSGLELSYSLGNDSLNVFVAPGERVPLQISSFTSSSIPSDLVIALKWDERNWYPLRGIRLRENGTFVYSLLQKRSHYEGRLSISSQASDMSKESTLSSSSTNKRLFPVVLDIMKVGDNRVLDVSSLVKLQNNTTCRIDVGVQTEIDDSIECLGTIEPHGSFGLPFTIVQSSPAIVIRVTDQSAWSSVLDDKSAGKAGVEYSCLSVADTCNCHGVLRDASRMEGDTTCTCRAWSFLVSSVSSAPSNTSDVHPRTIYLDTLWIMQNRCPTAMHLLVCTHAAERESFESRDFHLAYVGKLDSDASAHMHHIGAHDVAYFALSLDGVVWSRLHPLRSIQESARDVISIKDSSGQHASFDMTALNRDSGRNTLRLVFQPRYIIQNRTSKDIVLKVDANDVHPVSAQDLVHKSMYMADQVASLCQYLNHSLDSDSDYEHLYLGEGMKTSSMQRINISPGERRSFSISDVVDIHLADSSEPGSGSGRLVLDRVVTTKDGKLIRLHNDNREQWHDVILCAHKTEKGGCMELALFDRYEVINHTDVPLMIAPSRTIIEAKSMESLKRASIVVNSGSSVPFHWFIEPVAPSDTSIRIKGLQSNDLVSSVAEDGWRWSGKLSLGNASETSLKLSNRYSGQVYVIRAEVRAESAIRAFLVFTSEQDVRYPLYRIINSTNDTLIHYQQKFDGAQGEAAELSSLEYCRGVMERLFPGESLCFGWDEAYYLYPLEREISISFGAGDERIDVALDSMTEVQSIELPASRTQDARLVYVYWYLYGNTKTLRIHDQVLEMNELTTNEETSISQRAGGGSLSLEHFALSFELPILSLSIINSYPEELVLVTALDVFLNYKYVSGDYDEVEIKLGKLHADNQLENATFPVLFTPIPSRRSNVEMHTAGQALGFAENAEGSNADDATLHVSVLRVDYGDDIEYIKYLAAMLQPVQVQLDDFLLVALSAVMNELEEAMQEQLHAASDSMKTIGFVSSRRNFESDTSVGQRVFIETLQLHPVRLHLTFQQTTIGEIGYGNGMDENNGLPPLVLLLLRSRLVNIDQAAVHLNALHVYHAFASRPFLLNAVRQHYMTSGLRQVYALLGAADVLGNPLGLVANLGTGVHDFFYEPIAGMVHSPQEFVLGLSRGTASLVKNSLYGTFNAASKFTGSLSSNVAALSFDEDYINARNSQSREESVSHLGHGLLYGYKRLGQGVFEGVSGLVSAPAVGAYNYGLSGFVEGVGKGLLGAAVKPAAGVLDLAAKWTAGISVTATVFDDKPRNVRMRLPRAFHEQNGCLMVFSNVEAKKAQMRRQLMDELLDEMEEYIGHVHVPPERLLIGTTHRIVLAEVEARKLELTTEHITPDLAAEVLWEVDAADVLHAKSTRHGVEVTIAKSEENEGEDESESNEGITSVLIPLPMSGEKKTVMEKALKLVSTVILEQRELQQFEENPKLPPVSGRSTGITFAFLTQKEKQQLPVEYDAGARVAKVQPGSSAWHAGLHVGDIVVGFNDDAFEPEDFRYELSLMDKGDLVDLYVLRVGQSLQFQVQVE